MSGAAERPPGGAGVRPGAGPLRAGGRGPALAAAAQQPGQAAGRADQRWRTTTVGDDGGRQGETAVARLGDGPRWGAVAAGDRGSARAGPRPGLRPGRLALLRHRPGPCPAGLRPGHPRPARGGVGDGRWGGDHGRVGAAGAERDRPVRDLGVCLDAGFSGRCRERPLAGGGGARPRRPGRQRRLAGRGRAGRLPGVGGALRGGGRHRRPPGRVGQPLRAGGPADRGGLVLLGRRLLAARRP
jgi:hypothetical protein